MPTFELWGQKLEMNLPTEESATDQQVEQPTAKEDDGSLDIIAEVLDPVFVHYRPWLINLACTQGLDYHSAEDLVQDTYLHTRNKFHQLREHERVSGWIRTIVTNTARNLRGRNRLQYFVDLASEDQSGVEPSWLKGMSVDDDVFAGMIGEETKDILRLALPTLDDISRQTIEDFYLEGLHLKDISELRDVPVGTVKRRLHVARFRLHTALEKRGVTAEDLL